MSRNMKKTISFLSLFLLVSLLIFAVNSLGNSAFSKNSENIDYPITVKKGPYDTQILLNDGIVLKTDVILPHPNEDKLIVHNPKGPGFLIANKAGNIIDPLSDLESFMKNKINKTKSEEDLKHVPLTLGGAKFFGENSIIYVSNYDSNDWRQSIWEFDLKTRNAVKLLDSNEYGDVSLYVSNNLGAIIWAEKEDLYYLISPNGNIELLDINGVIEGLSNDGKIIVYSQKNKESLIENVLIFYNTKSKSISKLQLEDHQTFNGGSVFNDSSTKFSFLVYNHQSQNLDILVYDILSQISVLIPSPEDVDYSVDSNIRFINEKVIEVALTNNKTIQFTLN